MNEILGFEDWLKTLSHDQYLDLMAWNQETSVINFGVAYEKYVDKNLNLEEIALPVEGMTFDPEPVTVAEGYDGDSFQG